MSVTEYTGVEIPVISNNSSGAFEGLRANFSEDSFCRQTDRNGQLYVGATGANLLYNTATGDVTLQTEEITPDYGEITEDSGLLAAFTDINAGLQRLTVQLYASTAYDNIDGTYQYKAFKYDAKAFYKITFDYQVVLASGNFILELLDDTGTVKWSKNGSSSVTDQVVNMISTGWTFRVRCTADTTTDLLFNNWVHIDNIHLERYKDSGYLTQGWWHHPENLHHLGTISLGHTDGAADTNVKARMMFSDTLDVTSPWLGTSSPVDYYTEHGPNDIYTGGYAGYYFKSKVWLESDGRYTPTLKYISYTMTIKNWRRPSLQDISQPGMVPGIPVGFKPLDWNLATHVEYNNLETNGRIFERKNSLLEISQIGAILSIPIGFKPLNWNLGTHVEYNNMEANGREFWKAKTFRLSKSWAEAVWGVVLSGYCRDQNNEIILGGKQIILECTSQAGKDTLGIVYPDTGLFQAFIKEAAYDKRTLVVEVPGKPVSLALQEYGSPNTLDVTEGYPENQDLHFWKEKLCKSVAHVDSLVTY